MAGGGSGPLGISHRRPICRGGTPPVRRRETVIRSQQIARRLTIKQRRITSDNGPSRILFFAVRRLNYRREFGLDDGRACISDELVDCDHATGHSGREALRASYRLIKVGIEVHGGKSSVWHRSAS